MECSSTIIPIVLLPYAIVQHYSYNAIERTHVECNRMPYMVLFTSGSIRTTLSHGVRDRAARRSARRYEFVLQSIRVYAVAQHEECSYYGTVSYTHLTLPTNREV